MKASIQNEVKELGDWDGHAEAHSIYEAMQQLKDRRRNQGKRYPIALIMTYLLLAKAAGETTLQATSEWIRLRGAWLQEILPQAGPNFPCAATYSNVLRAVDPLQLNAVLMDLLTRARAQKRKEGEQQHVALDGKTLRGTQGHLPEDQKKMHQVSLYETQTGIVLAEQIVGDKENELSRINEILTPQCIKGRIVSADGLHTQQAFCLGVTVAEGDYVLFAKGNQPTLHEDLYLFFHEPPLDCHDWRIAHTCDTGHGRLEMRDLVASTEREWLSQQALDGYCSGLPPSPTGLQAAGVHPRDGLWLHQFDSCSGWPRAPARTGERPLGDRKSLSLASGCHLARGCLSSS
jgi:hypothetical protein